MTYPGGKAGAGVYQQIINQIPPHRVYIEPFLGGGAVMLHKKPAIVSIGIDNDTAVVSSWSSKLATNGDVFEAQPGVSVIYGDAISYLQNYRWQGDEFVYCDPPYLMETRSCKRPIYFCEFGSIEQHERLLKLLLSLPCCVAISGYQSSLYSKVLANWRTISYQTRTRGGRSVREYLWMNYPKPLELHDYRYLGNNFRERERIKRIKTRWLARLDRMDDLERYAMLSSIAEYNVGIRKASPETMVSPEPSLLIADATRVASVINSDENQLEIIGTSSDTCRHPSPLMALMASTDGKSGAAGNIATKVVDGHNKTRTGGLGTGAD